MYQDIKNIIDTDLRFKELKKLTENCDWDNDSGMSKQDSDQIKSFLNVAKNKEKDKLSSYASDLAKKI